MKRLKKRRGSAYLLVVMLLVIVSVVTSLLVTTLNHSVYQLSNYSLQMKAYYLNREAQEAVVSVLLKDENKLLNSLSYPTATETLKHYKGTDEIGESKITLVEEQHTYYTEANAPWVVAYVETKIPDGRAGNINGSFTYQGTVMILKQHPLVQIYNVVPDAVGGP